MSRGRWVKAGCIAGPHYAGVWLGIPYHMYDGKPTSLPSLAAGGMYYQHWTTGNQLTEYNGGFWIQCKPDISRSCISRNWIYRGRMLDPIFLPTDFANFADVVPKSAIFSRNRGNSLHSIRGRQFFAKSAHRDSLCSCSLETIFREINSSLPVNAGWNTCCAMGSRARRSIDTSIVSQSRVQLIQCQCKSRLQTSNLGINNAFNQIAVWPRCLHPPFCPSLRQFRSKSSVRDW